LKVLILDHYFRQDIDALLAANHRGHIIRTLSPYYFADAAIKWFPKSVWGPDFQAYHAPELANARAAYRAEAQQLIFDLYRVFPFDVFVTPSDTFFYIRDVIDACRSMAIPFIVVQKETGVATGYLKTEAEATRRWFPFAGDWMTTSSHRSLDFWLAAGAKANQVSVVGQPRYDFYQTPSQWIPLATQGIDVIPGRRLLLFLSYNFDAYDEKRGVDAHRRWERLHRETESVLLELADSGEWNVMVKPHPQQDKVTVQQIRARLAGHVGVSMVPSGADTRQIIVASDMIVGFQTTGLAEAMAAGKCVVYTYWTDEVIQAGDALLPFHLMEDSIGVARSPDELRHLVREGGSAVSQKILARRLEQAAPYLGELDGHASDRVWSVIEDVVSRMGTPNAEQAAHREQIRSNCTRYGEREARRAIRRAARRAILYSVVSVIGRLPSIARRLKKRLEEERDRATECGEAVSGTYRPVARLVGHSKECLWSLAARFLVRRIFDARSRP
jgi:hypothetical protein